MTDAPDPLAGEAPEDRQARLVSTLSRARGRSGVMVTERWLFSLGGALAVAGIALVVVGWVGTSRTVLVAGQIPYVVSGGLLGLGLIFLGGFLYFGYWLALLVRDGRRRADEDRSDLGSVIQSLKEITLLLEEGNMAAPPSGRRRRPTVTVPLAGRTTTMRASVGSMAGDVVATPRGAVAHRPGCPVVAGRADLR
ncbi:MAG TPA: hypothetical protein VGI06_14855, partial [Acidimicrobiales bacterium]